MERTSPSALTFARLLGEGPMARVALVAALAGIEGAAYIVSASGSVLHANPLGNERVARDPARMRDELRRAVEQREEVTAAPAPFVVRLRCEGTPAYFLVIYRAASLVERNVEYAAKLWELTPKQAEVLALVAEGFSNKTIAAKLACAERTVETHLTAIFEKSGISGRTALVATLARESARS